MKKIKFLGIAVAVAGVALSVGTAVALYQKGFDQERGIGFGGFTYQSSAGAYAYLSSLNGGSTGFEVESGNAALNPTNNTVTFTFKIAAAYGSESAGLVKQDAILGKLSITKGEGGVNQYLSVSAYVDGYESRIVDAVEQNYWAKADSLSARTLGGEGNTISAYIPSPTSVSANMNAAVTANKYLTVHVTATLSCTDEQFMNADEGQYSLGVRYEQVDDSYGRPYIVGDGTGWALEDEYAMVPNLGASSYEFCFKDLNSDSAHTFSQMKVLKNKVDKDASDIWNSEKWLILGAKANVNDNIGVDAGTTYFVTFKGDERGGFNVNGTNIYQD